MNVNLWKELFTENPMLIEVTRFRRKHFSIGRGGAGNTVALGLIGLAYVAILVSVIRNRDAVSPMPYVIVQTVILTICAPLMLYPAISGERERRSWDLLVSAPITQSQIVIGKFLGATAGLAIFFLLFLILTLIAATGADQNDYSLLLKAELVSATFTLLVAAMTILFTARVKRSLMALVASLGTLVTGLIVIPSFLSEWARDSYSTDWMLLFHPFYTLIKLGDLQQSEFQPRYQVTAGQSLPVSPNHFVVSQPHADWWGWPQTLLYLALTVVLLAWACSTLNFAENQVHFLPEGHPNA